SASTACSPTSPTPRSRPASCSNSRVARMRGAASRATATARGARSRTANEKRREPLAARLAHDALLADDCILGSARFDARGSPPLKWRNSKPRSKPMPKLFALAAAAMRPLAQGRGSCLASDRITIARQPVGFMYREPPDHSIDSGCRFFSGEETQEYADDASN